MDPIATVTTTASFWDGESKDVEQTRIAWDHKGDLTWNVFTINKKETADLLLQEQAFLVIENLHETVSVGVAGLFIPPKRSISVFLPKGLHPLALDINGKHRVKITSCEGV